MKKDLLTILDLTKEDINALLARSRVLKMDLKQGISQVTLKGKTMAMIFRKPSTRTRVSFQTGFYQMGGLALDLNMDSLQTGRGEPIQDTVRVLSRYVDIILVRTFEHREIEELARFSAIPVINGLTDLFHPCQVLSDLFTIQEYFGDLRKTKISYIGDGNNVAHSWLNAAGVMGLNLCIACPQGYEPQEGIFNKAQELVASSGGRIELTSHPLDAVLDADVIYTDVWVSMGQEKDAEEKREKFSGFQVNQKLIEQANPKAIVMHCLPAHRGEEITEEILEKYHLVIFEQAENRLHVQKAIVEALIKNRVQFLVSSCSSCSSW